MLHWWLLFTDSKLKILSLQIWKQLKFAISYTSSNPTNVFQVSAIVVREPRELKDIPKECDILTLDGKESFISKVTRLSLEEAESLRLSAIQVACVRH